MTSAIVLGGGMAGMLAASVLARHATVTVIESDRFPDSPRPRRGLPQGHHSHMLMGGGAQALESLLPGVTDTLYARGAKRRVMGADILTLSTEGWSLRHDSDAFMIACSRDLLDHVVREQVLSDPAVTVLESAKATGFTGDARRVTGVRLEQDGGAERTLSADLVVDATGRRSRTPDWLAALGVPAVPEQVVDSGLAYASRLFQVPDGVDDDFPAVLVQPESGTGRPGRGGTVCLIEGDRWIVTLIGTRGGEPPTDESGFTAFPGTMRDPVLGELFSRATPVGEIRPHRGTANRRRYYEKTPMPDGLAVIGDALASLNPVYAHGMSVAAKSAVALRAELERTGGIRPGLAARYQKRAAKETALAWTMASTQDLNYPHVRTEGMRRTAAPGGLAKRFGDRLARTALSEPVVARSLFDVYTLAAPASRMLTPAGLLTVVRGPRKAPLTTTEALAQFPGLKALLAAAPVRGTAAGTR
ncbi:NAD(P)/FAD-dependent oxidoreductase [Streptomyces sp. NPDC093094]|uniref:NAD(P)/FAD-dependent oxidoreductase n=1 Tax=Streptomyces sp. NPDC093094 TaxID=3366026 RepID=UPI0038064922